MSTAAEFVAQRPPQPCSVDDAPRTKQLGNRLWGMEKYDRAVAEFDSDEFSALLTAARSPD
jgi:hypothetical protein